MAQSVKKKARVTVHDDKGQAVLRMLIQLKVSGSL